MVSANDSARSVDKNKSIQISEKSKNKTQISIKPSQSIVMKEKNASKYSPEKQISIKQSPNLETIDHDKGKQPNAYLNG